MLKQVSLGMRRHSNANARAECVPQAASMRLLLLLHSNSHASRQNDDYILHGGRQEWRGAGHKQEAPHHSVDAWKACARMYIRIQSTSRMLLIFSMLQSTQTAHVRTKWSAWQATTSTLHWLKRLHLSECHWLKRSSQTIAGRKREQSWCDFASSPQKKYISK